MDFPTRRGREIELDRLEALLADGEAQLEVLVLEHALLFDDEAALEQRRREALSPDGGFSRRAGSSEK